MGGMRFFGVAHFGKNPRASGRCLAARFPVFEIERKTGEKEYIIHSVPRAVRKYREILTRKREPPALSIRLSFRDESSTRSKLYYFHLLRTQESTHEHFPQISNLFLSVQQ